MKNTFLTALFALFFAIQVQAASVKAYEAAIPLTRQAAVLEAAEEFMQSPTGKSYTGAFHINSILANGVNPATHLFALLMPSMAAIHDWESSLVGNEDIQKFWSVLDENATPVTEYMGSLIKTWGDVSNADNVWMLTKFRTTNPAAVVAGQDMLSEKFGDKFPGQVVLHSLAAGTRNGANGDYSTHMFVVGYESVAEMEEWISYLNTQPAWAEYLSSLRDSTVWQGSDLIQNSKIYDNGMDVKSFHGK